MDQTNSFLPSVYTLYPKTTKWTHISISYCQLNVILNNGQWINYKTNADPAALPPVWCHCSVALTHSVWPVSYKLVFVSSVPLPGFIGVVPTIGGGGWKAGPGDTEAVGSQRPSSDQASPAAASLGEYCLPTSSRWPASTALHGPEYCDCYGYAPNPRLSQMILKYYLFMQTAP